MENIIIILLGLLTIGVIMLLFRRANPGPASDQVNTAIYDQQIETLRQDAAQREQEIIRLNRELTAAETHLKQERESLAALQKHEEE
ncbi:MAG: hypothetical protein ACKO7D_04415 [Bacteroidota bacterium]